MVGKEWVYTKHYKLFLLMFRYYSLAFLYLRNGSNCRDARFLNVTLNKKSTLVIGGEKWTAPG